MPITLTHRCLSIIPRPILDRVLDGTHNINNFCHRIEKNCEQVEYLAPELFKGHFLELFTEYLLKIRGSDNRIGINEYKLIEESDEEDLGVDGYGVGANNKPATVQVKYRHSDYILTNEDKLTNFTNQSLMLFEVDVKDINNMLIITTAKDIHHHTRDSMLCGKVRTLARPQLRQLVDNDSYFWQDFHASVVLSCSPKKTAPTSFSFRPHQDEAIEEIFKDDDGQGKIILPTGTGKTLIEAEAIAQHITYSDSPQTIKVYGSRILLCFQLISEVQSYLLNQGIDVDVVNFNSGYINDKKFIEMYRKYGFEGREIQCTTSNLELKKAVKKAHKNNRSIIVVTTYHSAVNSHRKDIHVDMSIFDEAHNAVNEQFKDSVKLPSDKKFFFTATEKYTDSDEGHGMNNEELFGNVIYQRIPKEMIECGEICRPFIHLVKTDFNKQSDLNDAPDAISQSIISAFFEHEKVIKREASDPSKIGAKILISAEGQDILDKVLRSQELEAFREEHPHVHIGALSSELGIYYDGEHMKRATHMAKEKFLTKIKDLKDHESCIIFNVDMIGEGIDVPGITGVMPFRNMNNIKFTQFLGRAMRLHLEDRIRFYNGDISPDEPEKYIKPKAWVIIPDFLQNSKDFRSRYETIINQMKYEYGFSPTEHILYDDHNGICDAEVIDPVNTPDDAKIFTRVGMVEYVHELENQERDRRINDYANFLTQEALEAGDNDFSAVKEYLRSEGLI